MALHPLPSAHPLVADWKVVLATSQVEAPSRVEDVMAVLALESAPLASLLAEPIQVEVSMAVWASAAVALLAYSNQVAEMLVERAAILNCFRLPASTDQWTRLQGSVSASVASSPACQVDGAKALRERKPPTLQYSMDALWGFR